MLSEAKDHAVGARCGEVNSRIGRRAAAASASSSGQLLHSQQANAHAVFARTRGSPELLGLSAEDAIA